MADSAAGSFHCKPVPWLKEYLKQRGIQSSGKRKVELVELCEKSEEMKVPKIAVCMYFLLLISEACLCA